MQKGSEILRKEATNNLQKLGGDFVPDFYGGKARMGFTLGSRNDFPGNIS